MQIVAITNSSNNVTVVTDTGTVLTSHRANIRELRKLLGEEIDLDTLNDIMFPETEEQRQEKSLLDSLGESVTVNKDKMYLRDNPVPVPHFIYEQLLHSKFSMEAITAFWNKAVLNPNVVAREALFEHLSTYGINITDNGNFVAYRNVSWKSDYELINSEVIEILSEYVKAVNGDSHTKTFTSAAGDTLSIQEWVDSIKLHSSHDGKFAYKLFKVASIPRWMCDETQATCSRGLHLAGASWLKRGSFGSVGLVCLCNPKDVVSAPIADDYGKLRTCRLIPIGIANYDAEGNLIPVDSYTLEDMYDQMSIDDIMAELKAVGINEGSAKELSTISSKVIQAEEEDNPVFRIKDLYYTGDSDKEYHDEYYDEYYDY